MQGREPPGEQRGERLTGNVTTTIGFQILFLLLLFPQQSVRSVSAQGSQVGPTRNPHGPLVSRCEDCHTLTSWKPIRAFPEFNHNTTRYPLRGMHAKVDCRSCHVKLVFRDVGMKCADCHADLHRGQMGAQCEKCHTVNGWNASIQAVQDHQNRFPLVGAHAVVECSACHTGAAVGKFQGLSTDCVACHLTDVRNTKTTGLDHAALNFPTNCQSCHSMDTWLGAGFDHAKMTGFALVGAHAKLDCTACHVGGRYAGVPADCYSCHAKDFTFAGNPNHVTGGLPHDCTMCHTMSTWQGATFDHSKFTKFPLIGAHVSVACTSCHVGGKFVGTPTDCYSCHKPDFVGTTNPSHVAAGFPTDCSVCHTTANWNGATFNHSNTPFPLTGAHLGVGSCATCHVGGVYAGLSTACVSCHMKDYTSTTNPNHAASGIPQTCGVCHSTTAWSPATFDHSKTPFPLTGGHVSVACTSCHVGGKYAGTPTDCYSCHKPDFVGTTNPNHVAAGFPTDCTVCHTTANWTSATFNHSNTPFPLTGAHVSVACTSCHIGGKFAGTPTDCYSCHKPDFVGTKDPNHVAAGFPTGCSVCHTTANWNGATFNHNNTPFPLTGAHLSVGSCTTCHVGGVYAGLSTACVSCHVKDYNGTTNPNHAASGIPQTCEVCHTTSAWSPATFDHTKFTTFPLTGAHVSVPCASCHIGGKYAGTPTDCYSCHKPDFVGTTNPNHVAAGFPTDCTVCHSTANWTGATFNHNNTPFPLTGAHLTVGSCATCHVGGVYAGLSTTCVSCHLKDYNGTTNPPHAASGIPQTCQVCHTTTAWSPATFDHSKTVFPLTGVHVTVPCASCHVGGKYAGTPTDCYSCHKPDYLGTTNPNHAAAGFPTTCLTCHTTTAWTGATFNHTWFPVPHRTATLCNDCHTNPSNYAVFVCTNCHTQATTDPHHTGVTGYVWNSTNCYSCHPTGKAG